MAEKPKKNDGLLIMQAEGGEIKVISCDVKMSDLVRMSGHLQVFLGLLYVDRCQKTLDDMKNMLLDVCLEAAEIVEKSVEGKGEGNGKEKADDRSGKG